MTAAARIDNALADLRAGRVLDADSAALLTRAVGALERDGDAMRTFMRAEGQRSRDEALCSLAAALPANYRSTRAKARRILELANRYELGRWRRDRHKAACPYRVGTADADLWRVFAEGGGVPALRQLQSIIA